MSVIVRATLAGLLGFALLAAFCFVGFFSEAENLGFRLSADGSKQPFPARRGQRSWSEDTADWTDGAAQSVGENSTKGELPANSIIGRSKSVETNQTGSAVAIGDSDEARLWLTARHMIAGCASIRLGTRSAGGTNSLLAAVPLSLHPTVDLALIETAPSTGKHIAVADGQRAGVSSEAVHIGFPGGRPAAIYSAYLGLTRVRWVDNSLPTEAYRVWVERTQIPNDIAALGGLSGGATIDREGEVIGTVVGVSERRGRILSTRPTQIAYLVHDRTFAGERPSRQQVFDERTFPVFARQLVEQRQVVRLNCARSSNK